MKTRVTYLDGREVVLRVSPKALVATEDFFGGTEGASQRKIKAEYYALWATLQQLGKESADFETFMGLIAHAEDIDEPEPTPTGETPSSATSSD